jgi:DNA-binding transcriptional regulator YhcF (GntR family)
MNRSDNIMTDQVIKEIIDMWDDPNNFPSKRSMARKLGMPRTTVRRWINKLIDRGIISAERDYEVDEELVRMLKSQNTQLATQLKKEKAKTLSLIESCKTGISKLNIKPVKVPSKRTIARDMAMHALRSDEHIGEKVIPEEVQGVAEYNVETYIHRLNTWLEKILIFKQQDSESHGLNKLVLSRLGDFVTGFHAYKGQPFYVDMPAVDQVMLALEHEIPVLQALCAEFNEVETFAVVGNHGTTGTKGTAHRKDNWDYILYNFIKLAMKDQPNFKMYISQSPHMIVRHGNYNFLLTHGDNMRSYLGLPFYALDRTFLRINNLYGMRINFMCSAHNHTPANIDGKIIMNGSFVGGTDLSINRMSLASLPSQKIFYFDDEHGPNRETDIHLSHPLLHKRLDEDEQGIYTAWT